MNNKLCAAIALCVLLTGCGPPPDEFYCQNAGEKPGTKEYGDCLNYYHNQDAQFQTDLSVCEQQADVTYPQSLYDYGGSRRATVFGGYGGSRWGDDDDFGFGGSQRIWIDEEPDEQHNAQVDALRQRIILPCMNAAGWRGSNSWQQGRIQKRRR